MSVTNQLKMKSRHLCLVFLLLLLQTVYGNPYEQHELHGSSFQHVGQHSASPPYEHDLFSSQHGGQHLYPSANAHFEGVLAGLVHASGGGGHHDDGVHQHDSGRPVSFANPEALIAHKPVPVIEEAHQGGPDEETYAHDGGHPSQALHFAPHPEPVISNHLHHHEQKGPLPPYLHNMHHAQPEPAIHHEGPLVHSQQHEPSPYAPHHKTILLNHEPMYHKEHHLVHHEPVIHKEIDHVPLHHPQPHPEPIHHQSYQHFEPAHHEPFPHPEPIHHPQQHEQLINHSPAPHPEPISEHHNLISDHGVPHHHGNFAPTHGFEHKEHHPIEHHGNEGDHHHQLTPMYHHQQPHFQPQLHQEYHQPQHHEEVQVHHHPLPHPEPPQPHHFSGLYSDFYAHRMPGDGFGPGGHFSLMPKAEVKLVPVPHPIPIPEPFPVDKPYPVPYDQPIPVKIDRPIAKPYISKVIQPVIHKKTIVQSHISHIEHEPQQQPYGALDYNIKKK